MKKAIITALAVSVLAAGYFVSKMDLKRVPDVARIFDSVVVHRQNYERTLLEEISSTGSEYLANDMIEKGYVARKRINEGRKPAPNFAKNPYDLRIVIEHAPNGDEAYLLDNLTRKKLPIDENNQVGDFSYRITGVYQSAEKAVASFIREAKSTALSTIDGLVGMFSK